MFLGFKLLELNCNVHFGQQQKVSPDKSVSLILSVGIIDCFQKITLICRIMVWACFSVLFVMYILICLQLPLAFPEIP